MSENRLILFLFGATGDLATRKLYPAIYRLYKQGHISRHFALIGSSRREWSHDYFRTIVKNSIKKEIENDAHADEFLSHLFFQAHDVTDADHYFKLKELADTLDHEFETQGNRIFYISLSPLLFPVITMHLKKEGLIACQGYSRLIIEKPFGHNLETAQELQAKLTQCFDEEQIYRIDHYLGKEIVHSLRYLRFNNATIRNLWNSKGIDNIQICLDEEVGVEERAGYYEQSGATRDMIQNHILQILALSAMDEPEAKDATGLRKAKLKVFQSLNFYQDLPDFQANVVRGQYGPSLDGQYNGYRQENDIQPNSTTETFFAAKLCLDIPSWQGVPFFIRSGKRLDRKASVINIVFKRDRPDLEPNRLRIEIGPKMSYQMFVNAKAPGYQDRMVSIPFKFEYSPEEVKAMPVDYERLIFECIEGNLNNFNHYEEIIHAWKFIDHLYDYWAQCPPPTFPNYPAHSQGPQAAHDLLARYGTRWYE